MAAQQPQPDRAWGSLAESGASLDSLLQFASSVAFSRLGSAMMQVAGYQVLDSAGTGALKQACEGKPAASSVGLGFSAFNSLTGGGKSLSVYFPFTSGIKPPLSTGIRTSSIQSPLWKLPSRLLLSFNNDDEVDARLEWLDDISTARDHKTVTWVTQDRYLSQKINMADANWVVQAVPGLLVNALKFRLNSPFEGSGSLWWQGYPETVTPSALGLQYSLFTPALPLFSASPTDWNARGQAHIADLQAPGPDPSLKVDYTWIQAKYDREPRNFLAPLPNGLDSLPNYGLPTQLGFLYAILMPKELFVARTHQMSANSWISASLAVKTPLANTEDGSLSMSVGLKQNFKFVGLENVHTNGIQGLGLQRAGEQLSYAAFVWKFAGGSLQVAAEGFKKIGVFWEARFPTSDAIRLRAGLKWGASERLNYGAGITAEL